MSRPTSARTAARPIHLSLTAGLAAVLVTLGLAAMPAAEAATRHPAKTDTAAGHWLSAITAHPVAALMAPTRPERHGAPTTKAALKKAHKARKAKNPAALRADFGDRVLTEARKHAGTPYVYGANGPGAFDCSGFVDYVYRTLGYSLPRTTYSIFAVVRHIPASAAAPGDLIFLDGLGHVAIYAGPGMMWDAPSSGGVVRLRPIYSSYLVGRVTR